VFATLSKLPLRIRSARADNYLLHRLYQGGCYSQPHLLVAVKRWPDRDGAMLARAAFQIYPR
jgi:hypothetical protein